LQERPTYIYLVYISVQFSGLIELVVPCYALFSSCWG